jgi:hypothetical protein
VQHIVLTVKNVLWRTKVKTATFRPWSQLREVVLLEPLQYNILWLLEPFIPARSLTVLIQEGCSTRSTTALVDVGSVHLFWSSEAVHPYPNWCKCNNGDSCPKRVPLTTRKKSEWWLSSSSTLPIHLFKHISNVNVLLKHRHYIILYYASSWYTYPMFLQNEGPCPGDPQAHLWLGILHPDPKWLTWPGRLPYGWIHLVWKKTDRSTCCMHHIHLPELDDTTSFNINHKSCEIGFRAGNWLVAFHLNGFFLPETIGETKAIISVKLWQTPSHFCDKFVTS